MSINKKKIAQIPQWTEDGYDYKGVVEYGMHYLEGNSLPYFSITASTWCKSSKGRVWREDSCGCLHDLIAKRKKLLATLIPFHLSDQNGLPMHYLENGYYWYKKNLETFKSYVRLSDKEQIPEVPKIELPIALSTTGKELDLPEKQKERFIEYTQKQFITQWLKTREDKLKQEFDEVMTVFGVEYITKKEIDQL